MTDMKRFIERIITPHSFPRVEAGINSGNQCEIQREQVQETWEELAAPLRSGDSSNALSAYQALQELKKQLHRRAEERRAKAAEHLNQAKYFNVLASCWCALVMNLSVDAKEPPPLVLLAKILLRLSRMNELPQVPRVDIQPCKAVKRTMHMKLREFRPDSWEEWSLVRGLTEMETHALSSDSYHERSDDLHDRYVKYRQDGFRWDWHLHRWGADINWARSLRVPNEVLKDFGVDPSALPFPERDGHSEDLSWAKVIRRHQSLGQKHKTWSREETSTARQIEFRRSVLNNVLYQFEVFGSVESLTDEEVDQIMNDKTDGSPPITGYNAPEYAVQALEILQENPGITTFSSLAAQWDCGGRAKVDTIKRGIGYDALPKEKKSFNTFKGVLKEKVRLMKRG